MIQYRKSSNVMDAVSISKKVASPKNNLKIACILFILFVCSHIYGQNVQQVYLGPGFGLDYGGIGGKVEYLPVKNFGIFGGLGYNLLSVGWNVGATYKILPDKRVSPNLMLLYGYNGVYRDIFVTDNNLASYGPSIGGNVDLKIGRSSRQKVSVGLFVSFQTKEFKDKVDKLKTDTNFDILLLPIQFSVGYNFKLNK